MMHRMPFKRSICLDFAHTVAACKEGDVEKVITRDGLDPDTLLLAWPRAQDFGAYGVPDRVHRGVGVWNLPTEGWVLLVAPAMAKDRESLRDWLARGCEAFGSIDCKEVFGADEARKRLGLPAACLGEDSMGDYCEDDSIPPSPYCARHDPKRHPGQTENVLVLLDGVGQVCLKHVKHDTGSGDYPNVPVGVDEEFGPHRWANYRLVPSSKQVEDGENDEDGPPDNVGSTKPGVQDEHHGEGHDGEAGCKVDDAAGGNLQLHDAASESSSKTAAVRASELAVLHESSTSQPAGILGEPNDHVPLKCRDGGHEDCFRAQLEALEIKEKSP